MGTFHVDRSIKSGFHLIFFVKMVSVNWSLVCVMVILVSMVTEVGAFGPGAASQFSPGHRGGKRELIQDRLFDVKDMCDSACDSLSRDTSSEYHAEASCAQCKRVVRLVKRVLAMRKR